MEPRYQHDCEACQFLGRWRGAFSQGDDSEMDFDLYQCRGETLIARFGDDGPDYVSGLVFRETILPLAEAYRRALEQGVTFNEKYAPLTGDESMKLYEYDKKILGDAFDAIERLQRNGLFYGADCDAFDNAQAAIERKLADAQKQIEGQKTCLNPAK